MQKYMFRRAEEYMNEKSIIQTEIPNFMTVQ